VNLGISKLPLATLEPLQGALLPCTEACWDRGEIGSNEPLFASSFLTNTEIGSFASACQACHILGVVLRHRDNENNIDPHFRLSEALQLHQTLVSLNTHLDQKKPADDAQSGVDNSIEIAAALCYSARITLYNIYACNENYSTDRPRLAEETEMQRASIEGLKAVTKGVYYLAKHISETTLTMDVLISKSPVVLHCLYEASTELAWFISEEGNMEGVVPLKAIVGVLKAIGLSWQVSGKTL
jgi:hypothetical protein